MSASSDTCFTTLQHACPIEAALAVIGNKWKGYILHHLLAGTKRFNELKRLIPNVTQRVLTLQLRELEKYGVVIRTVHAEIPPKVEYSLSPLGSTIKPLMHELDTWGKRLLKE